MRLVIDLNDKSVIFRNQFIKSGNGVTYRFEYATRMAIRGKSGKILASPLGYDNGHELYDHVFNLLVIDTREIDNVVLVEYWDSFGIDSHKIMSDVEANESRYHYNV